MNRFNFRFADELISRSCYPARNYRLKIIRRQINLHKIHKIKITLKTRTSQHHNGRTTRYVAATQTLRSTRHEFG